MLHLERTYLTNMLQNNMTNCLKSGAPTPVAPPTGAVLPRPKAREGNLGLWPKNRHFNCPWRIWNYDEYWWIVACHNSNSVDWATTKLRVFFLPGDHLVYWCLLVILQKGKSVNPLFQGIPWLMIKIPSQTNSISSRLANAASMRCHEAFAKAVPGIARVGCCKALLQVLTGKKLVPSTSCRIKSAQSTYTWVWINTY